MKVAFYAPFKPLGHKNPSGDLMIATGLVDYLNSRGHTIAVQSRLRARWIYFKPHLWPLLLAAFVRCYKRLKASPPDLWLTYHTYYKSPDLLGPLICRALGIKYLVFQGIYSTKRRRKLKTVVGFYLNRMALQCADHLFTNKLSDLKNLKRIIPGPQLDYIRPGIYPDMFERDEKAGAALKEKWGVKPDCPVILSACMFRDDVKTKGLSWMIKCCRKLVENGTRFHLVIAGSGKMEKSLKMLAREQIPGHVTFAGKFKRSEMHRFYSAGDLFAFPGIRESLGMVYLEAQSCGLPVVAFDNGGIPEVVNDGETGFLTPMYDGESFCGRVTQLLTDAGCRRKMGRAAGVYVREKHDLGRNYSRLEKVLLKVAG